MNFIREVVGGPKKRYKHDGFNLDLTYITKRIIAMAFPGSGIQKIYRNSIDVVAEFLHKNHQKNYLIINLSNREIEENKLHLVKSYTWEDHKSPPLLTMFQICMAMGQFLNSHPDNVCVIHCNHGKGRTGTIICCFLLFAKDFMAPEEAMAFYSERRFQVEGQGVTQPCQIHYIHYFHKILKQQHFPRLIYLRKLLISDDHQIKGRYFKVKNIYGGLTLLDSRNKELSALEIEKENEYSITMKEGVMLTGDITIDIKEQSTISKTLIGSYSFNTSFLSQKQGVIEVGRSGLSPLSVVKGSGITNNFKFVLFYQRACKCQPIQFESQWCEKCKELMRGEKKVWVQIHQIVEKFSKLKYFEDLSGLIDENRGRSRTVS